MRLSYNLQKFVRDRRGSVSMMTGLIIPVLATGVMVSVEFNNMVAAEAKMQNRADAVALFAANKDSLLDPNAAQDLQDMARERMLVTVRDSGINVDNVQTDFTFDATRKRIVGEVTFSPRATFVGSYFLPERMSVETEAAPLLPENLEISLVLDLSGSMNLPVVTPDPDSDESPDEASASRIEALRAGVHTLIDELDAQENVNAKYAVVPYASSVDLTNLAVYAPFGASAFYQNVYGGNLPEICARENFGGNVPSDCLGTGNNNTQDPRGSSQTGLWAAERYVSQDNSGFTLSLTPPTNEKVPVITQRGRADWCDNSYIAAFGSLCIEVSTSIHGSPVLEKNHYSTRDGVLGLTASAQAAKDYVDDLSPEGGTAGHLGTIWGLYALTPSWAQVFQHPSGAPRSFNDPESHKIMVIMTDGEFTVTQDPNISVDGAYAYFQAACELAREQGVEIYAVGLRASQITDEELTECAGSAVRYFGVDDRAALIRAFEQISDSATQVRLSG